MRALLHFKRNQWFHKSILNNNSLNVLLSSFITHGCKTLAEYCVLPSEFGFSDDLSLTFAIFLNLHHEQIRLIGIEKGMSRSVNQ
jgi:hypothetical protein